MRLMDLCYEEGPQWEITAWICMADHYSADGSFIHLIMPRKQT